MIRPDWKVPSHVHAAFTLRTGGVSAAPFDTLNIAMHVGDASDAVAENRRRVRELLALPAEPAWLEQVHGTEVVDLDASVRSASQGLRSDAAITRSRGRVCAIQVADCMPVLFSDRAGSAVGAAHAGWRGLAGGVLEATVAALGGESADLTAWLGPAIGPDHFEVGDEVREAFVSKDSAAADAFVENPRGRWQCDLNLIAVQRLAALGVTRIHGGNACTYADRSRFFSYRRDGRCGRMAALVWLS